MDTLSLTSAFLQHKAELYLLEEGRLRFDSFFFFFSPREFFCEPKLPRSLIVLYQMQAGSFQCSQSNEPIDHVRI